MRWFLGLIIITMWNPRRRRSPFLKKGVLEWLFPNLLKLFAMSVTELDRYYNTDQDFQSIFYGSAFSSRGIFVRALIWEYFKIKWTK